MKYMYQITIIFAASLLGELLRFIIPLPIPASVYGLTLMFCALYFRVVKAEQMEDIVNFFIDIMPLMFVAPAIAILAHFSTLRPIIIQFTLATVVSTAAVLGLTGLATQFAIRLQARKKKDHA